jgi:hypothetical protein
MMTSDWLRQMQAGVDRWLETQREWWSALSADAEALVRRWTDAQREMWTGWLGVLQQRAPSAGGQDLSAAGTQMVDSLRRAAEQLVASQADWAKAWTTAQQEASEKPGEGSARAAGEGSGAASTRAKRSAAGAAAKRTSAKRTSSKGAGAKRTKAKRPSAS